MKYRNKDTGVIVEAMQIKCDSAQDILDFGDGLIRSIENGGLSFERMCVYSLELVFPYIDQFGEHKVHTHCIDCQAGDYLIKKDTSIFTLCEKEFKEQFETVEGENNNMKINLNDEVKVRLTDKALDILKESHRRLNNIILNNGGKSDKFPYKPDENGYYTFQLWNLFEDFGQYINIGCEPPFTNNEIVIGDIYNPLENITATLKPHERTIKDYILDKVADEKTTSVRLAIRKYIQDKLADYHQRIERGNKYLLEEYKKWVDNLSKTESNEEFLKFSEKEIIQMLGSDSADLDGALFTRDIKIK